ncbi:MAG: hypothetical protein HKM07_06860 [Chlamydiae bacterium]|nr:hypothetical protein [Chlamydiota bacterium]
MSFRKKIVSLVLFSIPCAGIIHALDGTWTATGSGNWGNSANWSTNPSFPEFAGDTATFGASITSNSTITITNQIPNITLQSITFNSPLSYTLSAASTDTSIILATNPSGNPVAITVEEGNHTILTIPGFVPVLSASAPSILTVAINDPLGSLTVKG